MKITKKKTTTVTETTTYKLHPNVVLREVVVNGNQTSRELNKCGKNVKCAVFRNKIDFWPVYNPDLKYLEESNPFWHHNKKRDEEFFKGQPLPEDPNDIDVSKIVLTSGYDHTFWNVDMEPIPVVIFGDYIDAGLRSDHYDLEKLHKYFSKHKQVKHITAIEPIPYYNNDSGSEKYFEVKVLPTLKQLKEMASSKNRVKDIFYKSWGNETDYLGMKKYYIRKDD